MDDQELIYYQMLSAKEIASQCQTSERAVKNYMKTANILHENGKYFFNGEIKSDVIAHCCGSDAPEQPETDGNGEIEIIELLKSQIEAQKNEIEILRSILTQQQKLMEQMNKTLDFIQNQAKNIQNNE